MRWLQRMGYSMIKIKRGLDLPITGSPQQHIEAARPVRSVALLGCDYHGMKPSMAVQVGDRLVAIASSGAPTQGSTSGGKHGKHPPTK